MEQIFESVKEIEKKISCFLSDDSEVAESIMIENAAMSLEYHVSKYLSDKKDSVLIMCGSGNNGADGYTLARRLIGKCKVNLLQCEEPKSFHCKKSFENISFFVNKKNESVCKDFQYIQNIHLYKLENQEVKNSDLEKIIEKSGVIVDCIFGTGFHGTVEEKYQKLFKIVNHSDAKRIACDIPSGLSGTAGLRSDVVNKTGGVTETASQRNNNSSSLSSMTPQELKRNLFFADKTVSMGAHKIGLFIDAAKDAVGKIVRASIGVSDELFFKTAGQCLVQNNGCFQNDSVSQTAVTLQPGCSDKIFLLEKSDAKLPFRKNQNSHKGNFGHTCVISGTKCGAAILSAEASLKSGTGLASIFAEDLNKPAEFKIDPSVMIADEIPQNANAFVLGPGFGRDACSEIEKDIKDCNSKKSKIEKYFSLIKEKNAAVVLDADSFYYDETVKLLDEVCKNENCINVKDSEKENLKSEKENNSSTEKLSRVILTPHPKEFSELLKRTGFGENSIKKITDERITFARDFSKKYPAAVLILKGANIVIAQNGTVYICTLGSPSLSKAGSGDVLTGIASALLAQNYTALDAAITAVIMHAIASTKTTPNYTQTAEDLIKNI